MTGKCRFCGAETVGSDVCHKCLDNPERQNFFNVIAESHLGKLEEKRINHTLFSVMIQRKKQVSNPRV